MFFSFSKERTSAATAQAATASAEAREVLESRREVEVVVGRGNEVQRATERGGSFFPTTPSLSTWQVERGASAKRSGAATGGVGTSHAVRGGEKRGNFWFLGFFHSFFFLAASVTTRLKPKNDLSERLSLFALFPRHVVFSRTHARSSEVCV